MMGPRYQRRAVDSQLFLPDTHWYTVAALDDAEVQVAVGLLQVPGTKQGTQGLIGAIADPQADYFEHPEHDDRVGSASRCGARSGPTSACRTASPCCAGPEALIDSLDGCHGDVNGGALTSGAYAELGVRAARPLIGHRTAITFHQPAGWCVATWDTTRTASLGVDRFRCRGRADDAEGGVVGPAATQDVSPMSTPRR